MKISRISYIILSLGFLSILISSCEEETNSLETKEQEERLFNIYLAVNYPDAEAEASGLYYQEHTPGIGEMPGPEDWVLVNHVSYTIPDNVVYDTYIKSVAQDIMQYDASAMYGPYKMLNGSINEGLTEGLSLMQVGGKATLLFTSELGFGSKNSGKVGAYRSLKYELELLEVIGDMEEIEAYEQGKIDTYLDTVALVDTVYDVASEQAVSYIMDVTTEGPLVGVDSTISVAYKGYLMDGRVFDEKTAEDPFIFKPGEVEWVARWDLVLTRLKEGEKVRMIFPYELGYGLVGENTPGGKVKIPPFETLIFDLEILSVEATLAEDPGGPE